MPHARKLRPFGMIAIGSAVIAAGCIACTGGSETRVPKDGPSLGAPEVPWKDKTRHERLAFMAAHVQPTMERLFKEHDAEYYPDLPCTTCHGEEMEARDYVMPGDIYALSAEDPIGDAEDYDEDIAEFMKTKVAPEMTRLLSAKPESLGESCFICHPKSE